MPSLSTSLCMVSGPRALLLSRNLTNLVSRIQRLQNKFIWLALRLPKYICTKLLHDSTGLPYVKARLLSRSTKSLDRTTQNPLVEESIYSNRLSLVWDRFPTPLSVVRHEVLSLARFTGVTSQNVCHCLKQAVRPIRRHVWHSPRTQKLKSQHRLSRQSYSRDAPSISQ